MGKIIEGFNVVDVILTPIKNFFKNEIVKPLGEFAEDEIFDPVADFVEEEVIDPIDKLIEEIEKAITDFFDIIIEFFEMLGTFFESIPMRFMNLMYALGDIVEGVGMQFYAIGEGLAWGFEDIGLLIYYGVHWAETYFMCGMHYIMNIMDCIGYYIVDIIFSILYLPVTILLWMLYMVLGVDLYPIEKQAWDGIETIDTIFYELSGVHLIYWPKEIREQCYTCIRLKTSVLENKAADIKYDFEEKIPHHIKHATDKEFEQANKRFNEMSKAWDDKVRHPRKVIS